MAAHQQLILKGSLYLSREARPLQFGQTVAPFFLDYFLRSTSKPARMIPRHAGLNPSGLIPRLRFERARLLRRMLQFCERGEHFVAVLAGVDVQIFFGDHTVGSDQESVAGRNVRHAKVHHRAVGG